MANTPQEMSLDEVLSSIKKMVVGTEPPVLELTDMVSENGDIVKVNNATTENHSSDMGSFLKLIQENAGTSGESSLPKKQERPAVHSKPNAFPDVLRNIATQLIQKWIDENLPKIVKETAEAEIKRILGSTEQ